MDCGDFHFACQLCISIVVGSFLSDWRFYLQVSCCIVVASLNTYVLLILDPYFASKSGCKLDLW